MSDEPVQLLVYRFGGAAAFRGQLAGVLERMEAGGALRVLDVVVVGVDAETGETFAVALRGGRAGGLTAALLEFRLDRRDRAAATRRILGAEDGRAELVAELAAGLEPGETLVALLVGHAWARQLGEAVSRSDGREVANAVVEQTTLAGLRGELVAAARG
jgi:hypothetical protein